MSVLLSVLVWVWRGFMVLCLLNVLGVVAWLLLNRADDRAEERAAQADYEDWLAGQPSDYAGEPDSDLVIRARFDELIRRQWADQ